LKWVDLSPSGKTKSGVVGGFNRAGGCLGREWHVKRAERAARIGGGGSEGKNETDASQTLTTGSDSRSITSVVGEKCGGIKDKGKKQRRGQRLR